MYNIQLSALSLRKALANIEVLHRDQWLVNGGFAFFLTKERRSGKTINYSLKMNYSPVDQDFFSKNVRLYLEKKFYKLCESERQRVSEGIKGLIAQSRSFEVLYHAKQKPEDFERFDHFKVETQNGLGSEKFDSIIDKIYKQESLGEDLINELDLFFLNEGADKFLKIPLPFLSTPTILLVINDIYDNDYDRAELIRLVYYNTREALYNYIYNILINNLQTLIAEESITSTDILIKRFIEEVCKILLPIQVSIEKNNDEIESIDYIKEWRVCYNTCESKFEFELKPEVSKDEFINYKATFFLTSFHFPIKEHGISQDSLIAKDIYKTDWIHKMPGYELYMEQARQMLINIFNLIYKQWKRTIEVEDHATKVKNHATKAATSRIINRNYAHHIGSHVSHRATADKILERIYGDNPINCVFKGNSNLEKTLNLKSVLEMENRLNRYKDERNEFISGIDSNTHPVPVFFYKDIIQPFIENSLLMDNIAKSEGICWEFEDPSQNDGKVKDDGISKLRIRVFYHKDLINKPDAQTVNDQDKNPISIKGLCCEKDVPCMHKKNDKDFASDRLSLSALGLDNNWHEMMAIYDLDGNTQQKCIHRLPYFKKLTPSGDTFYHDIDYSLDDIEVAIPGTLGAQSIYSLLENLIRNTAKHGHKVGNSLPVNIIIKVSPLKDQSGQINDDFFNMEITSNVITITNDDQIKKIEYSLQEKIDMAKALGFADMRINACLLAFRDINDANLEKVIEDLRVYPKTNENTKSASNNDTNQQTLGYCMRLTKPCKIVFVGEQYACFNEPEWNNQGFRQYDTAEACIKALGDMPKAFQFAVVQESVLDNPDNCDLLLKSLPWRVLVVPDGKSNYSTNAKKLIEQRRITGVDKFDLGEEPNADKLLEKCWDAWLRNRWKEPFALHMYFEKSEELEVRYLAATPNKSGFTVNIIKRKDRDNQFKLAEGFNVFYDRHGKYVGFIAAAIEREKNDYSRISWESFDKNNPDFDIIANDKLTHPKISFSKLIESGVHKILVIDERAREAGIKSHPDDWLGQESDADQYSIFAAASRVFIADSFVINGKEVLVDTAKTQKDNAQSTGNGAEQNENDNSLLSVLLEKKSLTYGGKLKDRCPDTNARNFCKFDTLIIHRTMLSKVFYISKEENYNLFKNLDQNFPNIIVTTGGGTLTYDDIKIMNRIRIMPFSTVRKFLLNSATAKNCITNLI